ncbi:MAG: hypothetical protein RL325_974, partial [Planctomycetota bacterium]
MRALHAAILASTLLLAGLGA